MTPDQLVCALGILTLLALAGLILSSRHIDKRGRAEIEAQRAALRAAAVKNSELDLVA